MTALVEAAVTMIVSGVGVPGVVMHWRRGHVVVMRWDDRFGMRRRLLPAQQRSCGHPTKGQQHREQHKNKRAKRLHGGEISTVRSHIAVQGSWSCNDRQGPQADGAKC